MGLPGASDLSGLQKGRQCLRASKNNRHNDDSSSNRLLDSMVEVSNSMVDVSNRRYTS